MRRLGYIAAAGAGVLVGLAPLLGAGVDVETEGGTNRFCTYHDRGVLPDGRQVWRSIQAETLADGSCPEHDACSWADVDFDGTVGFSDLGVLNTCHGTPIDY